MEWLIVIVIRFLVPLTILKFPLFGSILSVIFDNLDVVILDYLGVAEFAPYNRMDKFMDTYFALIMGYTVLFWKNTLIKRITIFLLVWRLVGVVLYEFTDWRLLLFIFPNVFLPFYIVYLAFKKIFKKDYFTSAKTVLPMIGLLLVYKLLHEYMLHIAQFPIYVWIKDNIFVFF